jgi:hypothetical protein
MTNRASELNEMMARYKLGEPGSAPVVPLTRPGRQHRLATGRLAGRPQKSRGATANEHK